MYDMYIFYTMFSIDKVVAKMSHVMSTCYLIMFQIFFKSFACLTIFKMYRGIKPRQFER